MQYEERKKIITSWLFEFLKNCPSEPNAICLSKLSGDFLPKLINFILEQFIFSKCLLNKSSNLLSISRTIFLA